MQDLTTGAEALAAWEAVQQAGGLAGLEREADRWNALAARASIEDLGRQVVRGWVPGLWYMRVIEQHLEACLRYVRGQPGGIRRLAISVPYQHGKSTIASELFPAWALGLDPGLRVIAATFQLGLAKERVTNTRRWMSSPAYLRAFPARFGPIRTVDDGGRERVEVSENGALKFAVRRVTPQGRAEDLGGFYLGASIKGGVNGRPYDIGVIDDAYKDVSDGEYGAGNPRVRARAEEFYDSMFGSREQARSVQILVSTRMHPEDLTDFCVRKWERAGIPYAMVRLPAVLDREEDRAPWDPRPLGCGLSEAIGPGAPQVKGPEFYRSKRAELEDAAWIWETCWQQRPMRREGAMFRPEWWRHFAPRDVRGAAFDHMWVSIDCAAKATGASWTCADLWASRGLEAWKLDELRGHWDLRDFEQRLVLWLTERNARHVPKVIEDGGFGRYVAEDLSRLGIDGWDLRGTGGLSKESRASMVLDLIRQGKVRLPDPEAEACGWLRTDWTREHVAEWGAFPTKGRACDRVDAGTWGLRYHLERVMRGAV